MALSKQSTGSESCPIAIIGIGCLFPNAQNATDYWRSIRRGEDGITEIPSTHWSIADYYDPDPKSPDKTYCRRGGFLAPVPFDPTEFGIPPNILEATDTTQLLSLIVAKSALEDAGYGEGREFNRERVSVVLGITGTQELVLPLSARLGHPVWRKALAESGVPADVAEQVIRRIADSYVPWQESSFPGLLGNVAAGRIANRLNLRGTNCVVDAACASSLAAVHLALLELATGRCDMALTGGSDTLNDIFMYLCFSKTPALSPTGEARPFADNADGTVLGEGLGMVVLKRLEDAQRDGDRIYAVIRGIGTSSDGRSQSIYSPHPAGQARALRNAYKIAGINPDTVELIEAHGTGTTVGDAAEFEALRTVFREAQSDGTWCAIGSVKSQIGHTKAAAGVAGLIKAAMAIYYRTLPPTIKIRQPSKKISIEESPFYLNTESRPWLPREGRTRRAGISAFGFGGSNFHAVIEEHPTTLQEIAWDGGVQIIALSADHLATLVADLNGWIGYAESADGGLAELAYRAAASRREFNGGAEHRLVLVARGEKDLARTLRLVREQLTSNGEPGLLNVPQAYYGHGKPEGKLAFIFPGQGSQYVGMGCEAACTFPDMLRVLTNADVSANGSSNGEPRLNEIIYPPAVFSEDQHSQHEAMLRRTEFAQPAIGAISLGLCRVLERFGVRPDLVAGHSYGELVALCVAGKYDEETLHTLSRLRGRLMAEGSSDRGAMLAVKAPLAELDNLIAGERLDVILANRNAPQQGVLAGTREAIGRAAQVCQARGYTTKPLAVAGAFHSRLMEGAVGPFRQALEAVVFSPGMIPAYSNTTGEAYPDDPTEARAILGQQLVRPVDFVRQIEAMYRDGARTLIEVGPRNVLTGLVRSTLGAQGEQCAAIDASGGRGSAILDLAKILAMLAAQGRNIDLTQWERPVAEPRRPRMTVPLLGSNYRATKPAPDSDKFLEIGSLSSNPDRTTTTQTTAVVEPSVEIASSTSLETPVEYVCETNQSTTAASMTIPPLSCCKLEAAPPDSVPTTPTKHIPESTNLIMEAVVPATCQEMTPKDPSVRPDVLQALGEGLLAMQQLQRQTAEAHQRFLELQAQAQNTLLQLILEQQSLPASTAPALLPASTTASPPVSSMMGTPSTSPRPAVIPADVAQPPATMLSSAPMPLTTASQAEALRPSRSEPISASASSYPASAPKELPISAEPASVTPPPVTTPATTQPPAADIVLSVVCEKTGYPREMIDLDMDVEADLGIDSIKRVEILAAIEERTPGWNGVQPDRMGEIRTLRQIVALLPSTTTTHVATVVENRLTPPPPSPEISPTETIVPPTPALLQPSVETASTPQASSPASIGIDKFSQALLEVVAQLTGYPIEMLELEMDMEADLGIDSIKRVEILAALEAKLPQMPPVKPDYMGSLRTLRQIVEYCAGNEPTSSSTPLPPIPSVPPNTTANQPDSSPQASAPSTLLATPESIAESLNNDSAHSLPPSVESPDTPLMIQATEAERLTLSLVELPPLAVGERSRLPIPDDAEVLITDDGAGLSEAIATELLGLGYPARVIPLGSLPADSNFRHMRSLIIVASPSHVARGTWDEGQEQFLKTAFITTKEWFTKLRQCGAHTGAVLVGVTRMDGGLGLRGTSFGSVSGGLAGLIKTAALEWPEVTCRAIDLDSAWDINPDMASALVRELTVKEPVEIGLSPGSRRGLRLSAFPLTPTELPISTGDVVMVTGGARGVTTACVEALAKSCRPTIVVLGRTALTKEEPDWLTGLKNDTEIKQAVLRNAFIGRPTPTPSELQTECSRLMAQRQAREGLQQIARSGARVVYYRVDLRDRAAVQTAVQTVQSKIGIIRGIIHGAGVLADRRIEDKTAEQFATVFDTKVVGLRHLLSAVPMAELRLLTMFSSVSARLGNVGQADYAVANEVLNKLAQRLSREWPQCRVVSINWGPWDGGMVTPGLRRQFENRGVGLLPLHTGAECFVRELTSATGPAEVVIAAPSRENNQPAEEQKSVFPASSRPPSSLTLAFERTLDLERHPFLLSHVIDGRPVLPVAMMIEWMGHAATHANPGLLLLGVDQLRVLKGVVLRDRPHRLQFMASPARRNGNTFEVDLELRGNSGESNSSPSPTELLHARATVVLAQEVPSPAVFRANPLLSERPYPRDVSRTYSEVLFHGEHFQSITEILGYSSHGMVVRLRPAPAPATWMANPMRSDWLTDPSILDALFQMGVLWCHEEMGLVGLPTYLREYRQYVRAFPRQEVWAHLEVRERSAHKVISDVTVIGTTGQIIARLGGYECMADASLSNAFRRRFVGQTSL